jgi:hypothetical protein
MQVIRHIIDRNQLLLLSRDNPADVFLKFVAMLRREEILSALDGEHNMEIDLRVRIGHERKMPLLLELENLFSFVLQRCRAYGAAGDMVNSAQPVFVNVNQSPPWGQTVWGWSAAVA